MTVIAGLITSAALGGAFLERWQLAQDDGEFCCIVQLWRCVCLTSGDFSQTALTFLHWNNGNKIKSGGFELDKTSGNTKPAQMN